MSMQRFGKGAWRIAQQIASRVENLNGTWIVKALPKALRPLVEKGGQHIVAKTTPRIAAAIPRAPSKNPLIRFIQVTIRYHRAVARPFAALAMHHRAMATDNHKRFRRPKLLLRRPPRKDDGIIERVRDIFGTRKRYNEHLNIESLPDRLAAYDIGGNIGYGCNAAVYALRLREEKPDRRQTDPRDLKAYPLALKLMYNYELDRKGDDGLWRGMGTELAPLPTASTLLRGRMGQFKPLPSSHPNIVHMATAFVDTLPLLPDARERYPDALPSAGFYTMLVDEPKTMFIVMKRYRVTLRDYIMTNRRNFWTCRVLLAQLLEGCTFLYRNKVSQRDMKSDNILLSYDALDEIPSLVISDFGCALATGSFLVEYRDETVDLGGNMATRAPEIALARPPSTLDFSLADTWAAGALAYEIFNRVNPFYSTLKSKTYQEEELPGISETVPAPIRKVIRHLLRRDPHQRVIPMVAANVLSLSLFRFGSDVRDFFSQFGLQPIGGRLRKVSKRVEGTLDMAMAALAAETIMTATNGANGIVSRAERQLRATFLSRMTRDDLWASVEYFEDSPVESETESELSDPV